MLLFYCVCVCVTDNESEIFFKYASSSFRAYCGDEVVRIQALARDLRL